MPQVEDHFTEAQIKLHQERVDRGWNWLEKNKPGWQEKVVIDDLDMASSCCCVFGFVYGTYYNGLCKAYAIEEEAFGVGQGWVVEHGFYTFQMAYYSLLNQLWTEKLQKYLLQQKTACGENPFYLHESL